MVYYMGDSTTTTELHAWVQRLANRIEEDGVLVSTNLPERTGAPEGRLTTPLLIEVYYGLFEAARREIHRAEHTNYKYETNN
jgi:hypothetical protein